MATHTTTVVTGPWLRVAKPPTALASTKCPAKHREVLQQPSKREASPNPHRSFPPRFALLHLSVFVYVTLVYNIVPSTTRNISCEVLQVNLVPFTYSNNILACVPLCKETPAVTEGRLPLRSDRKSVCRELRVWCLLTLLPPFPSLPFLFVSFLCFSFFRFSLDG